MFSMHSCLSIRDVFAGQISCLGEEYEGHVMGEDVAKLGKKRKRRTWRLHWRGQEFNSDAVMVC